MRIGHAQAAGELETTAPEPEPSLIRLRLPRRGRENGHRGWGGCGSSRVAGDASTRARVWYPGDGPIVRVRVSVTEHDETIGAASQLDDELEALRAAVERGDRGAASEHLRAIDVSLAKISSPIVRGLAYAGVQAQLRHPEVAVTVLEDLLHLIGDDPLIHHQLGCHRRQAGDHDGAITAFARACELDPTRTQAWLDLGIVLDERAQPQASIDCYREALRRAPTDFDVWRNLGNALAALQRFDEAIGAYDTALSQRPDDRTVLLLRAAAHQATGNIERANALTPVDLRDSMGEVVEVLDLAGAQVIGCRFRSPAQHRELRLRAASTLLGAVRRELASTDEGDEVPDVSRRSGWFLVRRADLVLVCDRDPQRPDHPNRFFDASEIVSRALRQTQP
jgi:tetratricopeptide (TPR) repeat protein